MVLVRSEIGSSRGKHSWGVALDSRVRAAGPPMTSRPRRSHSLVHQVFWALSPRLGDIFEMLKEGRDLLLQVALGKRNL